MLGSLKIPVNQKQYFTVFGGPFRECPDTMKGVKMAREVSKACEVDIPTEDYDVPDRKVLHKGLNKALDLLLAGEPVYVGCMGGMGRTGLFLAILAKTLGVKNPIKYVRKNYYSHAVETDSQYKFVQYFRPTQEVARKVKKFKRWAWLRYFWKTQLTRVPVTAPLPVKKAEVTNY